MQNTKDMCGVHNWKLDAPGYWSLDGTKRTFKIDTNKKPRLEFWEPISDSEYGNLAKASATLETGDVFFTNIRILVQERHGSYQTLPLFRK